MREPNTGYEKRSSIKLSDFVRLLRSVETMCELSQKNAPIVYFVKEIRAVLQEHRRMDANDFLTALKQTLSETTPEQKKAKEKQKIEEVDIRDMSFDDLRTLLSERHLTKEQLLDIGKIRFGIPKGSNKNLPKEELYRLIESTIANIETLHVIGQKASE